jgi:hypothetical protein
LYVGMLKPGEWTFEWEGQLEDGSPASPGIYEVETQSGPTVLRKRVQIGAE